jgi:hypothetical protein
MAIEDIKVVFISGPFRGENGWEVEKNIRRAEELSFEVWKLAEKGAKVAVICSHTSTRYFDKTMDDQVWIDGTQALLLKSDAMLLVPGWEGSEGTRGEVEFCKKRGIPYFETVNELSHWLTWRVWVEEVPSPDPAESKPADEVKEAITNLIKILEARAEQVFDKIQENPGSAKADYVLIKYFELMETMIDKVGSIFAVKKDDVRRT